MEVEKVKNDIKTTFTKIIKDLFTSKLLNFFL